jgi:hypothetical protein
MDKASEAAAFAGWAQNPNAPVDQRLATAAQALNYYVDQQDKLRELLQYCEDAEGADTESGLMIYSDVARKLRAILDGAE